LNDCNIGITDGRKLWGAHLGQAQVAFLSQRHSEVRGAESFRRE
jgi:hypothetical protein